MQEICNERHSSLQQTVFEKEGHRFTVSSVFAAILPEFIYLSLETPPKNTMVIPDGKRALE